MRLPLLHQLDGGKKFTLNRPKHPIFSITQRAEALCVKQPRHHPFIKPFIFYMNWFKVLIPTSSNILENSNPLMSLTPVSSAN